MPAPTPSRYAAQRFAALIAFVGVTALLAAWHARQGMPMTVDAVRDLVLSWGPFAPMAYIGVFVLRPFLFFPTILLFVGGGLVFGAAWGTLYGSIGGTLGAVITFGLARALGREFVQAKLGNRFPKLNRQRWGAGLVFVLNLLPIVPITAINYGAGLSRVGIGPFTLAVIAGLTPRAFAYSYFGSSLFEGGTNQLLIAGALLALLIVVPTLLRRRLTGDS